MFEVSVEYTFAAGHALRDYKGKCENLHGHNYKVRVTVEGENLDSTGLLIDFGDLRAAMKSIVDRFDHQFLNEMPPFDEVNPSAENIARYFSDHLHPRIQRNGLRVQAVTVWESDTTAATFRPLHGQHA
jgi:6-pyruvoyltetrahydropterin/6-carboxytetrahydropterin synthase